MNARFTPESDPAEVLEHYWGYEGFRPVQADIIRSVLSGHDTLGLMPTGGGKSITFQVPAMMLPGLTIVITPLISLMKDQVDNLMARGIRATCIYSGLTMRETRLAYDRCRLGKSKILYISPERLRSQNFILELRQWDISLIVVDEAHCISQWGYDFRPSYLNIRSLREIAGREIPVLALTASATPDVRDDIAKNLGFAPDWHLHKLSFARDNLSYIVRRTADKDGKLLEVLRNTAGSAIVYVRSRQGTRKTAEMLQRNGISAEFYHAGVDPEEKTERQDRWKKGQTRVMVATNAFGMGIDKADVRVVAHMDLPPSIEEYYQEAGRAGRDGLPAYAVIIAAPQDKAKLKRQIASNFPPKDFIARVYELTGNFLDIAVGEGYNSVCEFDTERFVATYRLEPRMVRGALNILTQSGYIEYVEDPNTRSRVMMLCRRDELYDLQIPSEADEILHALLRRYTGLFTDYVYISETVIARQCGCSTDDVYQAMLLLGRMKILHYVPHSANPYIYYTTSRELPKYLTIPKPVYEDRRAIAEARMKAVIDLAFADDECRQSRILRYFGEPSPSDCRRCDVCREHLNARLSRPDTKPEAMPQRGSEEYIENTILRYAAHPGGTSVEELTRANLIGRHGDVIEAIRSLSDKGAVRLAPDGSITQA